MSKKKPSSSCVGDDLPFLGPSHVDWVPDPHDYSFLSEEFDFSISGHFRIFSKLLKLIEDSFIWRDNVFTKSTAEGLAPILRKACGLEVWQNVLIKDSLFPRFASREVDKRLISDIAMLLAGNINILEQEQVIVPHYDMKDPVWVPMLVDDVKDDDEKPMVKRVTFYAEAGIIVGATINKYMSVKFIMFVLSQIGASRRTRLNTRDFFGTRFSVLLEKDKTGVGMSEFSTSSSQERYNKQLFKVRHSERPCHNDMMCSCADCVLGIDKCEYAVYKKSEEIDE